MGERRVAWQMGHAKASVIESRRRCKVSMEADAGSKLADACGMVEEGRSRREDTEVNSGVAALLWR